MNLFKNPYKIPENNVNNEGIIAKKLKYWLINFIRKYYNPKLTYIEPIIDGWVKSFVQRFILIIVNGFIFYLTLSGLVFVFPRTSPYIFIGTAYWHIPITILYLGIISWFFKGTYKMLRNIK